MTLEPLESEIVDPPTTYVDLTNTDVVTMKSPSASPRNSPIPASPITDDSPQPVNVSVSIVALK